MKVDGKHYRTIWLKENDSKVVQIIDQRREYLPHFFKIADLTSLEDFCYAISEMQVRGAGLIGATAGYGIYIASLESAKKRIKDFNSYICQAGEMLKRTRPTAVNLTWAVNRQIREIRKGRDVDDRVAIAFKTAEEIANEDVEFCKKIGENGFYLIEQIFKRKNKKGPINILTHCNAGWLAFVDYGSATSPIYSAFDKGIPVHVWVDVTGPWNQGSRLTAWELSNYGIPHHIISDNTGGHLMQNSLVDLVIVGADRVTRKGDVANKIGTYLKAVAAIDNDIPFYVAFPSSTFDWDKKDGIKEIPIEMRNPEEVRYSYGLSEKGIVERVLISNKSSPAANYSFDITPSRLVSGLITERGICMATEESILKLFPEHYNNPFRE